VNSPPPLVLFLEVDRRSDPISGVMHHPVVGRVPFAGWVGLAAALARVTAADDPDSPEVSST
jgi:hypothetical protein